MPSVRESLFREKIIKLAAGYGLIDYLPAARKVALDVLAFHDAGIGDNHDAQHFEHLVSHFRTARDLGYLSIVGEDAGPPFVIKPPSPVPVPPAPLPVPDPALVAKIKALESELDKKKKECGEIPKLQNRIIALDGENQLLSSQVKGYEKKTDDLNEQIKKNEKKIKRISGFLVALFVFGLGVGSVFFNRLVPDYLSPDERLEKIEYYQEEISDMIERHREELQDLERSHEEELSQIESESYNSGYEFGYDEAQIEFENYREEVVWDTRDNYRDWLLHDSSFPDTLSYVLFYFWGADNLSLNDFEEDLLDLIQNEYENYCYDRSVPRTPTNSSVPTTSTPSNTDNTSVQATDVVVSQDVADRLSGMKETLEEKKKEFEENKKKLEEYLNNNSSGITNTPEVNPPTTQPTEPDPVDPAPPTSYTVYITENGTKYHLGHCSYLAKSKIEIDRGKAISQGYTPCSRCDP